MSLREMKCVKQNFEISFGQMIIESWPQRIVVQTRSTATLCNFAVGIIDYIHSRSLDVVYVAKTSVLYMGK
jgi:hypothetical protein